MSTDRFSSAGGDDLINRAERRLDMGDDIRGGAYTDSYDKFIRRMYTPSQHMKRDIPSSPHYTDVAGEYERELFPNISASEFVKMDKLIGRQNEEEMDYEGGIGDYKPYSPLEMLYSTYGTCELEDKPYKAYQVYQPKQSSEYYSVMNNRPMIEDSPAMQYKVAKTLSSPNVWSAPEHDKRRYRLSPDMRRFVAPANESNHLLIDYSTFDSPKLSPYLYINNNIRNSDSRIVGSNFVQLTLRPKDAWSNRVDKLLDDCKNT